MVQDYSNLGLLDNSANAVDDSIAVTKKDGRIESFSEGKVAASIMAAANEVGGEDYDLAEELAAKIHDKLIENDITEISTYDIYDYIKDLLIDDGHSSTAERYIIGYNERERVREMRTSLMKSFSEITFESDSITNVRKENANIDSSTAMGTMLKYGSEAAKDFNLKFLIDPDIAELHRNGDIHIHDLDFYALTETCCQLPLDKLFKNGFNTGHGFIREPGSIRTAGAAAAIAIQSDQNDQHGGQSIPMLDFYLAPYVALSYVKHIANVAKHKLDLETDQYNELKFRLKELHFKNEEEHQQKKDFEHIINEEGKSAIKGLLNGFFIDNEIKVSDDTINKIIDNAYDDTYDETYQAMEAFIHNLNTMHSRAGAQVPFSSVNFGTDISTEGRMIIETYLLSNERGLGNGETPIFPISIFKLKDGVSFKEGDPNYDLKKLAIRVSAKRLFPNFVNLDAPYNAQYYKDGHPETEAVAMGCRTRVMANVYNKDKEIVPGRGNLSFTSINLPRLALKADHDIDKFFNLLDNMLENVHKQLLDRFDTQCRRHPRNYPFLMGQGIWMDSDKLGPNDDIRSILKNGTLTVGFIGLAETLTALIGKHHGESEEAQELGLKIVKHMRDYTDAWSKDEQMNYSVIGTPAEGLSGRFIRMDKEMFGIIPGVTDKDYYTNSSHVPVAFNITAKKKIDIESPYHELENGGSILYIEVDGDPSQNLRAFEKIIDYMHDSNAGYFSINHPVDYDPICGYVGIINDVCPRCGRRDGEPMTMEMWHKIHQFANVGNANTLGYHGDNYEEADRVPNEV